MVPVRRRNGSSTCNYLWQYLSAMAAQGQVMFAAALGNSMGQLSLSVGSGAGAGTTGRAAAMCSCMGVLQGGGGDAAGVPRSVGCSLRQLSYFKTFRLCHDGNVRYLLSRYLLKACNEFKNGACWADDRVCVQSVALTLFTHERNMNGTKNVPVF